LNELGRSPEEILEEAKGFPMSVADETLWLLGKGGSGEMTEEEKRRYGGYSDFEVQCGKVWWEQRSGYSDEGVELAVKRDRIISQLSSLCIQDQFGFLKMKGMLLVEMLGMSYSDIGIDRYKEGDGEEELRFAVDNLEEMVRKVL